MKRGEVTMQENYEVIVVGGGHAGCEASLAAARMGAKTLLITGNIKNIADMPCNPSIGGPAKGIIVREIDALGGQMGRTTDRAFLQMKMLNTKKGKAVQALRAQADKITYPEEMRRVLKSTKNLTLLESMVEKLLTEEDKIQGVQLRDGRKFFSQTVILTTGTYLKAMVLVGDEKTSSGPHGEDPSNLSESLKDLGFKLLRLKTGTPPRLEKSSIDFTKTKVEPGDDKNYSFSFDQKLEYNPKDQLPCHLVYTNELTHQIIKNHLKESSMYGGFVEGIGPRYCPSIEDKVVRFSDKPRHQLFLEPESKEYDDIYLQGFSTSMPHKVQEEMVHSIEGLEHAIIKKYAYAIEYDAIDPLQLKPSLETKLIQGLFTAGQINGTSGYEEAAGQGLIAGINAVKWLRNEEPFVLKRNEAYIGVLIDDLVTKGIKDPYRMLTSRAEYRLLLRHDNADLRLRDYGYQLGLISEDQYQTFQKKKEQIAECIEYFKTQRVTPNSRINEWLIQQGSPSLTEGISFYELLRRPELKMNDFCEYQKLNYEEDVKEQVEITIKYEGYIKKAMKEAEKMIRLEKMKIPEDFSYDEIPNLASEARQKLQQIRPESIGQATRISGVNPADIAILTVFLKKRSRL